MTAAAFILGPSSRDASEARLRAWEVELDRIELDVMRADRALAQGQLVPCDHWDRPGDHGPLPEVLRERAESLLARQLDVLDRLAEALGTTNRQRAVVEAMRRSSVQGAGAIYLDVTM